jgi:hypothetical protein
MKLKAIALSVLLLPVTVSADELNLAALEGTWLFSHMLLDGETNRAVNKFIVFEPDGDVVTYYDPDGKHEFSRATYTVKAGTIVYSDDKGDQNWEVLNFSSDKLHVDHRGAELFFERR